MRKISFLTLFFLLSLVSFCFANENDFRDTRWGMSPREVKTVETEKLIVVGESGLQYLSKLFEKKMHNNLSFLKQKRVISGDNPI